MDWSLFDFVLAAVLLGLSGALLVLAVRQPRSAGYRAAGSVSVSGSA